MIPYRNEMGELSRERLPTMTFFLDKDADVVWGMADGYEAARQAAWLILHTERYRYSIYSFDYGTELESLKGRNDGFLFPEIKRRVTEALLVDDRIIETSDFVFQRRKSRVEVQFTVHTVYGDMEMEWEL